MQSPGPEPVVGSALARLNQYASAWSVDVGAVVHAPVSLVAFGVREGVPVVLKIIKEPGDEWWSGEVASAFGARGMARVCEFAGGAMLLERLRPGDPLTRIAIAHNDDEATGILVRVMAAMSPDAAPSHTPRLEQWVEGFDRYAESGDRRIEPALIAAARDTFVDLAESQHAVRLLHGDLQHSNVLLDETRGWVAIDPKGVVGEAEYEIAAMLRNPNDRPDLFTDRRTIERRVDRFASELRLDRQRIIAWAFAQAVLSAVWDIEDGGAAGSDQPVITLAGVLRAMA